MLYDSGQVASSQTQHIKAANATLPLDASFDWAVRWWSTTTATAAIATTTNSAPSAWLNSSFSTGIGSGSSMAPWLGAAWIVAGKAKGYGSANQIRKSFTLQSPPARAALYVAAMDYYFPTVNGIAASTKLLGDFTNYEKRIWYDTHNITALLVPGENAIGFTVNSGWDARHVRSISSGGRTNSSSSSSSRRNNSYICIESYIYTFSRTSPPTHPTPLLLEADVSQKYVLSVV